MPIASAVAAIALAGCGGGSGAANRSASSGGGSGSEPHGFAAKQSAFEASHRSAQQSATTRGFGEIETVHGRVSGFREDFVHPFPAQEAAAIARRELPADARQVAHATTNACEQLTFTSATTKRLIGLPYVQIDLASFPPTLPYDPTMVETATFSDGLPGTPC